MMPPPYTTPVQIEDINPAGSSDADDLTNVNGTVLFVADDGGGVGQAGEELWRSVPPYDAAGTSVLDINPGPDGSDAQFLQGVGGVVFFAADDGVDGKEPRRSNGGPVGAGTEMVADIDPGADGSFPSEFTDVNGTAFFRAFGPNPQQLLWRSNGAGATGAILPGAIGGPDQLTNVGGTLFFQASDAAGAELWKATIEPAPQVQPVPPAAAPKKKKKCKKAKKKGKAAAAKKKKCKKKRSK